MNKIVRDILEANFFSKMFKNPFQVIDNKIAALMRAYVRNHTEVETNKILITTFSGAYNCNPKAIAEEILRRKLPWSIVWVTQNDTDMGSIPNQIKVVTCESAQFFEEASSAKIILANSITMAYFGVKKKPNQKLIQTWHGSIGIKRFDTNTNKKWTRIAQKDGKQTDYCISNSKFETDLFKNTFWESAKILDYGHARNDILLQNNSPEIQKIKEELYKKLNISSDTKVALYAPTFRDNKSFAPYNIDYNSLRDALTQKFGGNWVILIRLHDRLRINFWKMRDTIPDFVLDANIFSDIQDLMLITDVGITDYSSWICDYMLTKKAGFLFTTDLKKYNNERGFYFPLEELPFPIAENNEQLIQNILNFDEEKFKQKCQDFLDSKGCIEDGHAAERIVDKLEELMKE